MRKSLTHIGSKELISFYKEDIFDVPAKVDTGADYSAVWASDIVEENGKLSYCLFAPGSKYYTGNRITVDNYGVTQVKNSFGHVEQRYKVEHSIVLGKKKIKVNFRLADRSNNRYPVLIGKMTLSKRFVVDVSQNNILGESKRKILILDSRPRRSVKTFFEKVNDSMPELTCDVYGYDDMRISIDNENGIRIVNVRTGQDINDYDLVYFKSYAIHAEIASVVAEYAQTQGIVFVSEEVINYHGRTKLSQYAKLVKAGVPVVPTISPGAKQLRDAYQELSKELSLPFILKDGTTNKGQDNHLIHNSTEFDKVVKAIEPDKLQCYIAQPYIDNDGDYRLIVLDKELRLVMKRRRVGQGTHLNNVSAGGKATLLDLDSLPASVQAMAIRAALVVNRQIAGVDIIQDKQSGDWYLMEVNTSPQIATGSYVDEHVKVFAAFLKRCAEK